MVRAAASTPLRLTPALVCRSRHGVNTLHAGYSMCTPENIEVYPRLTRSISIPHPHKLILIQNKKWPRYRTKWFEKIKTQKGCSNTLGWLFLGFCWSQCQSKPCSRYRPKLILPVSYRNVVCANGADVNSRVTS